MAQNSDRRIDIFLPFYGDVEYFKSSVLSVIAQDSPFWNLTIVNDAHPDIEVDRWISELRHPNIKYYKNEINLGISGNFSKCLSESSSDYGFFLGSDDLLLPNFISRALFLIEEFPEVALIQPGVQIINEFGDLDCGIVDRVKRGLRKLSGEGLISRERAIATLLTGNWLYFPSIIWRIDLLKKFGFDSKLKICQDLKLEMQVIDSFSPILVDDVEVFQYRRHRLSESSTAIRSDVRFKEEKELHYQFARKFLTSREFFFALLALLHPTSRAHALLTLPRALKSKFGVANALRHLFT